MNSDKKSLIVVLLFELYDMQTDPHERTNLADDSQHAVVLETYKAKLKEFQKQYNDPWVMKWEYE